MHQDLNSFRGLHNSTVYLASGEVWVSATPAVVQTVLGSCVAAVLWVPGEQIGAMCHGAMPRCPQALMNTSGPEGHLRYVDSAIRHLAERLDSMGIARRSLIVKLFGGADVLPVPVHAKLAGSPTIGSQNTLSAVETLREEGLRLAASDLGGVHGRVIYFNSDSGTVLLRRINAVNATDIKLPGTAS